MNKMISREVHPNKRTLTSLLNAIAEHSRSLAMAKNEKPLTRVEEWRNLKITDESFDVTDSASAMNLAVNLYSSWREHLLEGSGESGESSLNSFNTLLKVCFTTKQPHFIHRIFPIPKSVLYDDSAASESCKNDEKPTIKSSSSKIFPAKDQNKVVNASLSIDDCGSSLDDSKKKPVTSLLMKNFLLRHRKRALPPFWDVPKKTDIITFCMAIKAVSNFGNHHAALAYSEAYFLAIGTELGMHAYDTGAVHCLMIVLEAISMSVNEDEHIFNHRLPISKPLRSSFRRRSSHLNQFSAYVKKPKLDPRYHLLINRIIPMMENLSLARSSTNNLFLRLMLRFGLFKKGLSFWENRLKPCLLTSGTEKNDISFKKARQLGHIDEETLVRVARLYMASAFKSGSSNKDTKRRAAGENCINLMKLAIGDGGMHVSPMIMDVMIMGYRLMGEWKAAIDAVQRFRCELSPNAANHLIEMTSNSMIPSAEGAKAREMVSRLVPNIDMERKIELKQDLKRKSIEKKVNKKSWKN